MLKDVSVRYIDWKLFKDQLSDAVMFILNFYYDEVDSRLYLGDMEFNEFLDWIRFEEDDFLSECDFAWKKLYKEGLIDAENFRYMERFSGREEELLAQLEDIPELREKVRQVLIEEDRIGEDDFLPESIRTRRPSLRRRNRR